jgi:hypothetical protein
MNVRAVIGRPSVLVARAIVALIRHRRGWFVKGIREIVGVGPVRILGVDQRLCGRLMMDVRVSHLAQEHLRPGGKHGYEHYERQRSAHEPR